MPPEKGRPRGKKRKAATMVDESESSPQTQGKGERYVPRFSNKRIRNTCTLSSTPQPAQFEQMLATEPAASDQSGEVRKIVLRSQILAQESLTAQD